MTEISKLNAESIFGKDAKSGAGKLCSQETCVCRNICTHHASPEHMPQSPAGFKHAVCPLSVYDVERKPDVHAWWEKDASEFEPSETELFALCACCGNTVVYQDGGEYTAKVVDFRPCLRCPVKLAEDAMNEAHAESCMG